MMTKALFLQAIWKVALGILAAGLLIFCPAGTLRYWRGWLFMGLLFVPMLFAGIWMMLKNPDLLRKRLQMKESQPEQALIIKLGALMFILGFLLAGYSFRLGWLLPEWMSWIAAGVFLLAYGEVLRENAYLSRTVEVQEGQKVVDTGLYGIVRHPMYSATVLLFLAMPLILGSLLSFAVFLFYPLLIAKRIQNEEKILSAELAGYTAYQEKVKYRLVPFLW